MPTTQAPDPQYTLEQAQSDIATLRGQLAMHAEVVSTVTDTAVLLYAPGANAIPRGPTFWSFEDGTTDSWSGSSGAVTNSVVTASGWPTDGTHSLLLTANGGTVPQAESPAGSSGFPSQPGDPVSVSADIYCPASQTNVFAAIAFFDDTGTFISNTLSTLTSFTAGQVQTLTVSGTAPDLTATFGVTFGSTNTLAAGQLIYGDRINVLGNLAVSISPGGGTDPVGNPYPPGVTSDSPLTGEFVQLNGAALLVGSMNLASRVTAEGSFTLLDSLANNTTPGVTITAAGTTSGTRAQINVTGKSKDGTQPAQIIMGTPAALPVTPALLEVQGTIAANTVEAVVSGAAETWHNLTGLIAGWTVAGARYKLLADSGLVLIEILNLVAPGSPPANGTAIWPAGSLPAAYRPAVAPPRHVVYHQGTATGETPGLQVETDGSIEVFGVSGNTVTRIDVSMIVSTL